MESTFALPLTEELRLKYERFFRQNPESVIDTILWGTGVDMQSIRGCGALSYLGHRNAADVHHVSSCTSFILVEFRWGSGWGKLT